MKYKNLAELKAAFDSGELDPGKCELTLDNDESFAYDYSKDEEGELVYRGPGKYDIWHEALSLLEIPCDTV